VAGLRRREGYPGALGVPYLADEDDVWGPDEGCASGPRVRGRVRTNLALVDDAPVVVVEFSVLTSRGTSPVAYSDPSGWARTSVQESRETSMLDHQAVQDIADRLGYPEAASWVREYRHEYLEGVSRGFVVAE
jgi:hypothetical protein